MSVVLHLVVFVVTLCMYMYSRIVEWSDFLHCHAWCDDIAVNVIGTCYMSDILSPCHDIFGRVAAIIRPCHGLEGPPRICHRYFMTFHDISVKCHDISQGGFS